MTTHYFNDDVKRGDKGENKLLNAYSFLEKDSTDGHDMLDNRNDPPITVEVKTDFYDMEETPNFFMERYSDDKKFKLGGPWRSANHNTDIFLYQFINNNKVFWFSDIPELVRCLDEYVSKNNPEVMRIKNARYYTLGFKIPREAVSHLYKELEFGEDLP